MTLIMKIQVKPAVDIELNNNEELESKKKDLWKRIDCSQTYHDGGEPMGEAVAQM